MPSHDPAVLLHVREWITVADEDLRLARVGMTLASACPYRLIAYHAQQCECVEKYLKAYLVLKGVDFPYTHNIGRLLDLCSDYHDWQEFLGNATQLTQYSITARHPGHQLVVNKEDATRVLSVADRVRRTVRAALKKEGVALPKKKSGL